MIYNNTMIKYDIKCSNGHVYESWFENSSVCAKLLKNNAVECPICGDTNNSKAIMAPNIPKKGDAPKSDYSQAIDDRQAFVEWVETNCDDVGEDFTEEVRAIHYDEKESRNIYGTTTNEEAAELREEGIDIINIGSKSPTKQ